MNAGWRRWVRIRRRDPAEDVETELRFHLDARIEDLVARGATPEAARARALEEFGDVDAVRAGLAAIDARIALRRRRAAWWEGIAQDLRYALRGMRRAPGFTAMVVVTLALGIGANAAVFAVVDRVFFAPPAGVVRPEQVRRLALSDRFPAGAQHAGPARYTRSTVNYPAFRDVAEAMPPGVDVAAYLVDQERIAGAGAVEETVTHVVGDYFGLLGVRPQLGRFFTSSQRMAGDAAAVVVIGDRLWRVRFGADRGVLGRALTLGARQYRIIGVAPPAFGGVSLDASDVWVPYRRGAWYDDPHTLLLWLLVRDRTGHALPAIEAAATRALRAEPDPRDTSGTSSLLPLNAGTELRADYPGESAIVTRLAAVAAIIFLITCANVANLLLVRSLGRRREIAVRLALGVSRRRLVSHALTESTVIAVMAGVTALLASYWVALALRRTLLPGVEWGTSLMDARLGVFAAAMALVAGAATGLLPALQGSRPVLTDALRGGARDGRTVRSRTRTVLVGLQASLSVVLLVGAGLFVRSLHDVKAIDLGYDARDLLFARVEDEAGDSARDAAIRSRIPEAATLVGRLPGVSRTALSWNPPMAALTFDFTYLPGRDSVPRVGREGMPVSFYASPGLFRTLGVRILQGRGFSKADDASGEPVVVVNRALARAYWPNLDPVGQCILVGSRTAPCRRVVGVVADAHVLRLVEGSVAEYYLPLAQAPWKSIVPGTIVIRTAPRHRKAVATEAARALRAMFGPHAIPSVRTLDDFTARELHRWSLGAELFTAAGLLALLVAAVGIYSAVSYAVRQRTHEIGVRLALGAQGGRIARLVVSDALRVVGIGVVIGVGAALALGRLVASLLYGVSPHDPVVLGGVAVVLVGVAIAASLLPAWRAARVDPMETLRAE